MIKILCASPTSFDATSFYRAYGIFPDLQRKLEIQVDPFVTGAWPQIGMYDILYLQRPNNPKLLDLAKYAKEHLKLKIWVDFDDNLFDLPPESRAFFEYDMKTKTVMHNILKLADVTTVSTPTLKRVFMGLGLSNILVIPNAFNDFWHKMSEKWNKESKNVVWRGSDTHVADMVYFGNAILDAIEKSSDMYHFLGYNPWSITNAVPFHAPGIFGEPAARVWVHKSEDNFNYHKLLKDLSPRIMHVPLIDNSLNAAKSNIAWIEATFAGAVTIAPAWAEWKKPGVICYSSFEEYTQLLTTQTDDFGKAWAQSKDYIQTNLLLSQVNELRMDMLLRLINDEDFDGKDSTSPIPTNFETPPLQPEII